MSRCLAPLSAPPTSNVFCFASRPVRFTRESIFWFRAFAEFVVIVAAVARQVGHNDYDISFGFFFGVLCTFGNDNLERINDILWLTAGLC